MPSDFAKKQLEKYGWKPGEGLGKNADGMSTYVRANKRRGDAGDCIGIGHEASKGTTNSDMGLDTVLKEIAGAKSTAGEGTKKKQSAKEKSASESRLSSQNNSPVLKSADASKQKKPQKRSAEPEAKQASKRPRASSTSSSSSSSSSDEGGAPETDNILEWDDEKLFKKCNGVRLGRAGRHRLFEGKLSRIAESEKGSSASAKK